MRICQLSHVEHTYNFLAPLFRGLAAEGHEVVAACSMEHEGTQVRRYLGPDCTVHRIPAARSVSPSAVSVDVLRLARYLRRERFDVVHVHGPLVAMQARLAAALAGVPVVVSEAHGFYFHDGQPALQRAALCRLEQAFCRHLTDVLVTVNEEDAELARRRRFRPDPADIVSIPGVGVDPSTFRPPAGPAAAARRREIRRALACEDDSFVVLFVGRLVGEKGVVELLHAFRRVVEAAPAARLWMVGDLLDSERDRATGPIVQALAASPELQGSVRLLGRRSDVADVLRAADVFVLPSHREGMPVSLLEAMATGLPVVTTDVRGCREAVGGGEHGVLVPAKSAPSIARALVSLIDAPGRRRELGHRARTRVLDRYSCDRSVAVQLELYRRLEARLADRAGARQPVGTAS